jgi:hypothetical protein
MPVKCSMSVNMTVISASSPPGASGRPCCTSAFTTSAGTAWMWCSPGCGWRCTPTTLPSWSTK